MYNSIIEWCGRFGNNIQQISNAIYFCRENNLNFLSPDNILVKSFELKFGVNYTYPALYFFHTESKLNNGYPDFKIENLDDLYFKRKEICEKYIYPFLKINHNNLNTIDEDTVVIHIRSGDIFSRRNYYCSVVSNYLQNPLSYYNYIIDKYKKSIVLTEDYNNPVIIELMKNPKVSIEILDVEKTIEIMLSAKNIATSGVSSFSPACILLSPNVKKVHCTNLFLDETLNHKDFSHHLDVEMIEIDLKRYINWNCWLNTDGQRNLMINYNL